jgi:hypothetical protein
MAVRCNFAVAARILFPHLQSLEAEGLVDAASIRQWRDEAEAADKAGTFFFALTFFVVAGSKPG